MFRYIDRGNKSLLVLIPGWATDYRIFNSLDLKFNYLLPVDFSPFSFERNLLKTLKESNMTKISIFGWSMGGFVAQEFALKYTDLIDELILVSIRKKYRSEELSEIKKQLNENKKGFLYKFYTQCFFKKEDMSWFRNHLLKAYCKELDLDYLLDSLDYLKETEMRPELLKGIKKIKVMHGQFDKIAPIEEAKALKGSLPQAKFVSIENTGHMPFLKEGFSRYL